MTRHIIPRLTDYGGIWAIEPSAASHLLQLSQGILANLAPHIAANAERVAKRNADLPMCRVDVTGASSSAASPPPASQIAVIDLCGCLMKSVGSMDDGTSTVRARQAIRAAANDPAVAGIVLRIDSPGGSVAGTQDLAAAIAEAAKLKPVRAFVEDLCASAAYWAASQCQSISANCGTALIGSIGTYRVIADLSKMAANEGIEVLTFATGPHKAAGVPGTAVTAEQRAYLQSLSDGIHNVFTAAVAAGRNLPPDRFAAGPDSLASGKCWNAIEAQALGLIDAVESWDDFINHFSADLTASQDPMKPNTNKDAQKMNIGTMLASLLGVSTAAEAQAKLDGFAAENKALAEQLAAAQGKVAALEVETSKLATEHEARAAAIISGLCARKLTEAEARAAIKTPAADLAKTLETKPQAVPSAVAGIVKEGDADAIRAAFEAETDQAKCLAMLKAHPFLAKTNATQE